MIRPSDEDVKLGGPLGAFDKSTVMLAPSFSFIPPRLKHITHGLHHNTTQTLIRDTFSDLQMHINLQ